MLTDEQREQIAREARERGETQRAIAKRYGVSEGYVSILKNSWHRWNTGRRRSVVLTDAQKDRIAREARKGKVLQRVLADRYNISVPYVSWLKHNWGMPNPKGPLYQRGIPKAWRVHPEQLEHSTVDTLVRTLGMSHSAAEHAMAWDDRYIAWDAVGGKDAWLAERPRYCPVSFVTTEEPKNEGA